MSNDDRLAGSFFNQVPDPDNDDSNRQDGEDSTDQALREIIQSRTPKPHVTPLTPVGGKIPTAKVTGFGSKKQNKSSSSSRKTTKTPSSMSKIRDAVPKSYTAIGPQALNDINNPEYDDQGYTLYANEETGEKARVFEALVNYPCEFDIKIVGVNEGTFVTEMVQLVAESCKLKWTLLSLFWML